MNVALDAFLLLFREVDETHAVLGHRSAELRAQHLSLDLQRAGIAGQVEVQSYRPVAGQHAIDFEQHAAGRDVEAAAENEAAVLFERDFDLRDRTELAANGNRRQLLDLGIELAPLDRTEDHVIAAGGETEVAMIGILAIGDEQERRGARQVMAADLAAELRRGHVEEIEPEDDEMRDLLARLLQPFGAGERRENDRVAAPQNRLLKGQRATGVVDEKNAAGLRAHGVICLSRATARSRSSTSIAACSGVFAVPRPTRMDPIAAASPTPIAVSTREGPRSPVLHAEPVDREKRRMPRISDSASTRSKLTFRLPGNLKSLGP